jgi:hypothetical protein
MHIFLSQRSAQAYRVKRTLKDRGFGKDFNFFKIFENFYGLPGNYD